MRAGKILSGCARLCCCLRVVCDAGLGHLGCARSRWRTINLGKSRAGLRLMFAEKRRSLGYGRPAHTGRGEDWLAARDFEAIRPLMIV